MIEIDGSFGEGGGQILRSSLALASVLGKDIRIFNIRAGRPEPGLKAQHLTGAKAVADLCGASYRGLEIGSTDFVFKPGPIGGGTFHFDVGTAGSITLVLQALMPLLPFASREVSLEVRGGTDVKWSPPIDYLRLIVAPLLARMGMNMWLEVEARGHFPRGGGIVRMGSTPSGSLIAMQGRDLGRIIEIAGVSHAAKLPRHVAERQAAAAIQAIELKGWPSPQIDIQVSENGAQLGPGSGMVLFARSQNSAVVGGDSLGERGRPAEQVGNAAARNLVAEVETGCFLDRHTGDMMVPYLTLAEGVSDLSVSQITQHTLTNVRVAELVAGVQFDPVGDLGKAGRLRVKGLGLRLSHVDASPRESGLIADS